MLNAVELASREPVDRQSAKLRGIPQFLTFFLPLVFIAAGWTLAVPLDGSPDEHRHLIYGYAIATGQVSPDSTVYRVPARLGINRSACYAFAPEESAACDRFYREADAEEITTATSANNYPRFYYRLAGWPLGLLSGDAAAYSSRLVGASLSCALLGLGFLTARRLRTLWLGLGLLLAVTPMAMFLVGSFNPHGMELAAAATFIAALLTVLVDPIRAGRLGRLTVLLAVPPMVLSRPNGFIWPVALTGLILMVPSQPRRAWSTLGPRFRWALVAVVAVTCSYAIWWQVARGGRNTAAGVIGPVSDRFDHPAGTILQILTKIQTFPGDWIGTFGWLDTRVTSATLFVWFATVGGLLVIGLALKARRLLVIAGVSLAVGVVFTVLVDVYYRTTLAVTVAQGRYVLPFAMLAVCLLALNMRGAKGMRKRLPGVIASMWILGSALALMEALRRYTTGVSLRSPSGMWEPPLPAALLFLVTGVSMVVLARQVSRRSVQ